MPARLPELPSDVIVEVLDDIQQENLVELRDVDRELMAVDIPLAELESWILRFADELINAHYTFRRLDHFLGHVTLSAADIQHG